MDKQRLHCIFCDLFLSLLQTLSSLASTYICFYNSYRRIAMHEISPIIFTCCYVIISLLPCLFTDKHVFSLALSLSLYIFAFIFITVW